MCDHIKHAKLLGLGMFSHKLGGLKITSKLPHNSNNPCI